MTKFNYSCLISIILSMSLLGLYSCVSKKSASIKFKKNKIDIGKVFIGDSVKGAFTFQNDGDSPLIVYDIKAACNCTIVKWTEDNIGPHDTGNIMFLFKPEPMSKLGHFDVPIAVKANTEPILTLIRIDGQILLSPDSIALNSQ